MITPLLTLAADPPAGAAGDGHSAGHGGYIDGPAIASDIVHQFSWVGDLVSAALILAGVTFMLVSSIGLVRMPDLYTRMQAAAKSGTLGVSCLVLACAAHFAGRAGSLTVTVETVLILVFLFLTSPVAAHLIGRSAYFVDVPTWDKTTTDELEGQYAAKGHTLTSPAPDSIDVEPDEIQPARGEADHGQPPLRASG